MKLHNFADASEQGLGAVAYARLQYPEEYKVVFLIGKSNVVSLKEIHRLELTATVMST